MLVKLASSNASPQPSDRDCGGAGRPASRLARCAGAAAASMRPSRPRGSPRVCSIPFPGRAESSAGHVTDFDGRPGAGRPSRPSLVDHRDPRLARKHGFHLNIWVPTMPAPATRCPLPGQPRPGDQTAPRSCWPPTICPRRPPFLLDWRTDQLLDPKFWGDREAACGFGDDACAQRRADTSRNVGLAGSFSDDMPT